jgi:hypothetical protein
VFLYLLLPQAQKYNKTQHNTYNKKTRQLASLNNKNRQLTVKVANLKKNIKNLELQKVALKKQKDFYEQLANLLDFVVFNQYKWGEFVKNLVKNAKNEGLDVLGFDNKLYSNSKKNELINKKMEITLKVRGEYKRLVDLMYKYENIRDLLRVEDIQIDKSNSYNVKFTLYGYDK